MATCAACGRDNPDQARFCMWCAAVLPVTAAEGQVRKVVTVVFCDVVGSTQLIDQLDAETAHDVMTRFFERTRTVLERHGGTVEKYIGDAVMAVFGIPTLHEDDALRAVRAAVDMRDALAEVNDDLERIGLSFSTRTGIDTGEVIVDDSGPGPRFVGEGVHVAARLQQAASPGEILVGRATYALVRGSVAVGDASSLTLKGFGEPVVAYRLIGLTPDMTGLRLRIEARLIGRVQEMRALRLAFDRCTEHRSCELIVIVGAAGVGKSRLAREFIDRLDAPHLAAIGRCLPYGEGITFWPVNEIVSELTGIEGDDTRETARAKLRSALDGAEDADLLFERVAATIGLRDATAEMQETFWAIRRSLEWAASDRPLVAVLDDLQWAEPALLDLVAYLVNSSRDVPILIVCTARTDLLEEHPDRLRQLPVSATVHLGSLPERETEELIDELLRGDRLDRRIAANIFEAAGGNPLFVEEILQMLREEGILDDASSSRVMVPPTIGALVGARLDRLSAHERAVIRAAAVIGKVFWWGAVFALVDEDVHPHVGSALQGLVRRELITTERSGFVGEDAFRFFHLVIQEVAYRGTPKELRADLHARFADWLERTAGDRIGEFEEILAYHRERAARYLAELARPAAEAAGPIEIAHVTLAGVGRKAFARGDMSAAASFLGRAHDILPDGDPRRARIAPELAEAAIEVGELARAAGLLGEAKGTGDAGLEAHARVVDLVLKESTDPAHWSAEALELPGTVIPVFEEHGDDMGLARAWRLVADAHWERGRYSDVERAIERAMHHARKADADRELAESLRMYAGTALYGPTPVAEMIPRCEWIIGEAHGSRAAEAGALRCLGAAYAMEGRIDEGRASVARASEILEDLGMRLRAAFGSETAAFVERLAGDEAAAEAKLRIGIETVRPLGERGFLSTATALLANILCAQDRIDEADEQATLAEQLGAADDIETQILWRCARAKVLAARGATDEAVAVADEAAVRAALTDDVNSRAEVSVDLAEVLGAAGREAEREEQLRRARELFVAKGNVVSAGRADRLLAGSGRV
jgi:class 3 adenylate cyclase/tetratricopeptide (TPR) repeat protein